VSQDRRCPNCGALVSEDAEWCGQCFSSLREPEPPPIPAPAPPSAGAPEANDEPEAPSADAPEAATPRSEEPIGAFWPCPVCGTRNPIVLEACEVCGTPFAAVMRGDTRRDADPEAAFRRSLLFPGLGHAMLGYPLDGFARGAVFALAVLVAILLPLSVPTTALTILAVVLSVAAAVGIYALSAAEVRRLAQRRGLLVESRFLLWGAVGLMMVTVGAIALSVASETRR
jgi:hypothetical protein